MTDIVQRLRDIDERDCFIPDKLCHEAADEIERLWFERGERNKEIELLRGLAEEVKRDNLSHVAEIERLRSGDTNASFDKAVDKFSKRIADAAEVGEPLPSVNWKDGKPYNYCPECGRDDRFLDAATIERCAQVADEYAKTGYAGLSTAPAIAAAIRALKDKP